MIYQNNAWRKETGLTLGPTGKPLEPVVLIKKGSIYKGGKMKKFEKGLKDPKEFTELKQRVDKYFGLSFEVEEADFKDNRHAKLIAKSPSGKIIIELDVSSYDDSWKIGGAGNTIANYHWGALVKMYKEKQ